ncbi:MAG: Gfo/Idh/MocA family oxidoreductase [Clostridiales bacterium]|nr:Gfo/Idh/MocA family oxidoreductase [Clostridiales bacterium]
MEKQIGIGIIGLGSVSRAHIGAIALLPQARLCAICDIDPAAMDVIKDAAVKRYTDYHSLLADPDVELVHILTPHYLHARMAIDALEAGKHVILEKPMASELNDAKRLIEAADRAKTTLSVIFQNRYNPSTRELKRLIDSGACGKLLGSRAVITWCRSKEYYKSGSWRGRWETEGGGALINQSIHTLDLLSYLGGPISRVKGHISTDLLSDAIEVEDNVHAVFEYASGARGVIFASTNYVNDAPIMLEMVFENATYQLWADKLFRLIDGIPDLVLREEGGQTVDGKAYWGTGHKAEIAAVYQAVLEGKQFEIDARSAYPALDLVKGIYESSLTGAWHRLATP